MKPDTVSRICLLPQEKKESSCIPYLCMGRLKLELSSMCLVLGSLEALGIKDVSNKQIEVGSGSI